MGEKLYLERRADDDEARKRFGFEVLAEESFMAQLGIMVQYPNFRAVVDDLYQRYVSASEAEKLLIIDESGEVYHQLNLQRYGAEVVATLSERSPYANVGVRVEGDGLFAGYSYVPDLEDAKLIQQWKEKVLRVSADVQEILSEPNLKPEMYADLVRILGEAPELEHIERFAIAYFLDNERARWKPVWSYIRAAINVVFGGVNKLADFGKQNDFCADVSLVAQILSDEMGYRSRVENLDVRGDQTKKPWHMSLVYEDGARFDPFMFPNSYGYLKNSADFDKEVVFPARHL